ncbi:MAG: hypothetical protein HQL95_08535 [Magnetococcales bacterium]|nr:hypothetical protein [Magnetococcales bacterium]
MPLTQTWTGDIPLMVLLPGLMGIVTALLVVLLRASRSMPALVPIPVRSQEMERRAARALARKRHHGLDD